ncbi:MAG TPA: hypothetical protein VFC12_03730 [Terriglobales bacterium]|nr:hypothetical protein [Terriglobales bacterium]
MNSLADRREPPPDPDYYARALAFWPRLVYPRPGRVRRDPHRVAALISRRTNLSYQTILELLGAPADPPETPRLDH